MPLPADTTLALQVPSNHGDPIQAKGKKAMIVRMSAETLEALENELNAQLDVEFSDRPGIYIGERFYPMRPLEEKVPHELYLRASSAARPSNALKLYASVAGKFTVERQLDKSVQEKVRGRTMNAEDERKQRKTILLDAPPDLGKPAAQKKRKDKPKGITVSKKLVPVHDLHRDAPGSSTQATRLASPRTVPASPTIQPRVSPPIPSSSRGDEGPNSLRSRLVHFIAICPRSVEAVFRYVGGKECDPGTKTTLLRLLNITGEKTAEGHWQLGTEGWKEIRPYGWPSLGFKERQNLAAQARMALTTLGVPRSDPLWRHMREQEPEPLPEPSPRASTPTLAPPPHAVARAATPDRVPRNGILTKDKQKKPKGAEGSKTKASDSVPMRDERPNKGKERETVPVVTSALSAAPTQRKLPGSGTKMRASGSPAVASTSGRNASPVPSSASKRPVSPIPERKVSGSTGPSRDERPAKRPKPSSPLVNEIVEAAEAASRTKKRKKQEREDFDVSEDEAPLAKTKKAKLESHKTEKERTRERDYDDERPARKARDVSSPARKARDASPPMRKTKDKDVSSPLRRARDVSPPRKTVKHEASPTPAHGSKLKRELSPAPPRRVKREISPGPSRGGKVNREASPGPSKKAKRESSPGPSKRPKREASPEPASRARAKREASSLSVTRSPLPPSRMTADDAGDISSASSDSRTEKSSKRRPTPEFSSTEDEKSNAGSDVAEPKEAKSKQPKHEEVEPIQPAREAAESIQPAYEQDEPYQSAHTPHLIPPPPPLSEPMDLQALAQYYQKYYPIYFDLWSKKMRVVKHVESVLKGSDDDLLMPELNEVARLLKDPEAAKRLSDQLHHAETVLNDVAAMVKTQMDVSVQVG